MMSQSHVGYNDKRQSILPYFPGYKYEGGKSTYRGEEVGEGGYVYAEPGIYYNVALLDIASMHPHSTMAECLFGPKYTTAFKEIVEARVSIKHEDWGKLKTICMMTGVSFVFFSDIPFSLVGFNLGYYLVIVATLLSIYSGIQYFVAYKDCIKQ